MDHSEFMKKQVKWIEDEKWYEGERRGCDPGEAFVRELIRSSAAKFREENS